MKREIATAVVSGLLLSGCGSNETPRDVDARYSIDLAALPQRLPDAVGAVASRAVLVRVHDAPKPGRMSVGSGLRIDDTHILTAGHLTNTKNNQIMPGATQCDRIEVHGYASASNLIDTNEQIIEGQSDMVRRFTSSHRSDHRVPDVALLSIRPGSYPHAAPLPIRSAPMKPGDVGYIISYQPKGAVPRDPLPDPSQAENVGDDYRAPAVYGAIVLGIDQNGGLEVATGLKSYGRVADTLAVHGSSGSAFFDMFGRYLGEVVGGKWEKYPANAMLPYHTGRLTESSQDLPIGKALVQLTPPDMLEKLKRDLASTPFCWENE